MAALAVISLSACVSLRSYHTNPPYGPVEQPPFKDKDIGFVEIDDHGLYWMDKQLPASMEMIETAAESNGAIVAGIRSRLAEQRPRSALALKCARGAPLPWNISAEVGNVAAFWSRVWAKFCSRN